MSALSSGEAGEGGKPRPAFVTERRLPPVTEVGMLSLALIVAGGIYLSSHLPRPVSLAPAVVLLALSALLLAGNLVLLARVRRFPWERFFAVARWALLAYLINAALIEWVFVRDHVRGGSLVVLTLSLVVFAVHVPTMVGFTVARFHDPGDPGDPGEAGEAGVPSLPGA